MARPMARDQHWPQAVGAHKIERHIAVNGHEPQLFTKPRRAGGA